MGDGGPSTASLLALLASGVALGGVLAFLAVGGHRQPPPPPPPPPGDYFYPKNAQRRQDEREEEEDEMAHASTMRARTRSRAGTIKRIQQAYDDVDERELALQAGFSMEEARQMADAGSEAAKFRTPQEVLGDLQRGNARFWTGQASRPEKSAFERRALISKQFPTTAILGCSDSRVPSEIVFDQGLGDMFVIRVAGNCLDTATTASLQYAVHHLQVKVVIVMGHEGCGAVKASQLPLAKIREEAPELRKFLETMKVQLQDAELGRILDPKACDREAVTANVRNQVELLMGDGGIMGKVNCGELIMLGAFYEISSGIVDFFHEVSTEAENKGTGGKLPDKLERRPSAGVLTRAGSGDMIRSVSR